MRQMYKPENIEIGGRIRSARETHGMTRDEFAEAVGISSQFASDLERGRMGASVETICRICQVLGITTDQLLLGRQPEPGITARQMESLLRGVSLLSSPFAGDPAGGDQVDRFGGRTALKK